MSTQQPTSRPDGELAHLTVSQRHRLLADKRRRLVLDVLADRASALDLDLLAADVATREGDSKTQAATVAISLYHHHLPMLDEFDVLDFDPDTNLVVPQ